MRKTFTILLLVIGVFALVRYSPIKLKSSNTTFPGLKTDTGKTLVDLNLILSGGPGKDGIPAINKPRFTTIQNAALADDVTGILVEFSGKRRFYPYTILVWHEVVNDSIGDTHFAVTFCPLCGSAIVFNRRVNNEIVRFGVSGLLFESNLVMYDDKTESLWSQVRGEAIVGERVGSKLEILPLQRITFLELKSKYPNVQVLSTDTGYSRDYSFNPYSGYETSGELYFPVSVQDKRFVAKELMYAFVVGNTHVAFPAGKLAPGQQKALMLGKVLLTANKEGGEITITARGEKVPGYFVMWFSWASHHQKEGIVWEM